MSPEHFFFPLVFALFFSVYLTKAQEDGNLLTKIKTLDDPNELWNLLKTASRSRPPDDEENEPDFEDEDLFGEVDDDDDLFKSEESENDVSTSLNSVKPFTDNPISTTSTLVSQNPISQTESQTLSTEKISSPTQTTSQSSSILTSTQSEIKIPDTATIPLSTNNLESATTYKPQVTISATEAGKTEMNQIITSPASSISMPNEINVTQMERSQTTVSSPIANTTQNNDMIKQSIPKIETSTVSPSTSAALDNESEPTIRTDTFPNISIKRTTPTLSTSTSQTNTVSTTPTASTSAISISEESTSAISKISTKPPSTIQNSSITSTPTTIYPSLSIDTNTKNSINTIPSTSTEPASTIPSTNTETTVTIPITSAAPATMLFTTSTTGTTTSATIPIITTVTPPDISHTSTEATSPRTSIKPTNIPYASTLSADTTTTNPSTSTTQVSTVPDIPTVSSTSVSTQSTTTISKTSTKLPSTTQNSSVISTTTTINPISPSETTNNITETSTKHSTTMSSTSSEPTTTVPSITIETTVTIPIISTVPTTVFLTSTTKPTTSGTISTTSKVPPPGNLSTSTEGTDPRTSTKAKSSTSYASTVSTVIDATNPIMPTTQISTLPDISTVSSITSTSTEATTTISKTSTKLPSTIENVSIISTSTTVNPSTSSETTNNIAETSTNLNSTISSEPTTTVPSSAVETTVIPISSDVPTTVLLTTSSSKPTTSAATSTISTLPPPGNPSTSSEATSIKTSIKPTTKISYAPTDSTITTTTTTTTITDPTPSAEITSTIPSTSKASTGSFSSTTFVSLTAAPRTFTLSTNTTAGSTTETISAVRNISHEPATIISSTNATTTTSSVPTQFITVTPTAPAQNTSTIPSTLSINDEISSTSTAHIAISSSTSKSTTIIPRTALGTIRWIETTSIAPTTATSSTSTLLTPTFPSTSKSTSTISTTSGSKAASNSPRVTSETSEAIPRIQTTPSISSERSTDKTLILTSTPSITAKTLATTLTTKKSTTRITTKKLPSKSITTSKPLPVVSVVTDSNPSTLPTKAFFTTIKYLRTTTLSPTTNIITLATKVPTSASTTKKMNIKNVITTKKPMNTKPQRTLFIVTTSTKRPLTTERTTERTTKSSLTKKTSTKYTTPSLVAIKTTKKPYVPEITTKKKNIFHSTTKITTTKKPDDLLPPPPLPPLPPPPLPPLPPLPCYKCHMLTTTQRPLEFNQNSPCFGTSICNKHFHPKPLIPYDHTHTVTTTPRPLDLPESFYRTKSLDPERTFLISDVPSKKPQINSPTVLPKRGTSLLPERKFSISLNDTTSDPKRTNLTPNIGRRVTENSNPKINHPKTHFTACSNCGQNIPSNHPRQYNPIIPENNRNVPHSLYPLPNPISPIPSQFENRFGFVISQENSDTQKSKTTPEHGSTHLRGSVPIVPIMVERRIIPNPFHNYYNPSENSRVGNPSSHIIPILISRQEPSHQIKDTQSFVKPTFDFIITNTSNSPGGQFQIKPVARNPDSRTLYFHINGQKPVHMHPSEQHSQRPNMVFLVKNQQQPINLQHPTSVGGYNPTDNGHQNLPITITLRRNKRSTAEYEPDDTQGTSLVFVFDTTGSMATELRQVQSQATELARAMTLHPDKPIYNYVFVPFNDPDVGPATRTTDHAYFQQILDRVQVNGGGDCPEMSMKALIIALEESKPRSFIYVFTDAGPKDSYLRDKVLNLIQKKQSMIVFLLTGTCELSDQEFYQTIATTSGGQVYDLDKTNINEVLEFIKRNLNSRKVNLVSVNSPDPAPEPKPYPMPVDKLVEDLTITVAGKKPVLSVYEPSGDLATPPKLKNMLDLDNLKVVNVKEPEPGQWRIEVGSTSAHSIRSTALSKSNIKFTYGFSVIPTTNLAETAHRPLQGANNSLLVMTHLPTSICNLTHVKLIDFNGNTIGTISLTPIDEENGLYSGGPVLPPNTFFNMEVQGYDSGGNELIRLFPSAITPQLPDLPEVTVKPYVLAASGGHLNLECHVESLVPVTVKWYRDGHIMTTIEYKQSSKSVLPIINVSRKTAGNYTCWTKNIAGILTKNITVSIADPPKVVVPAEISAAINSPGSIECLVQSDLPYNVTWSRQISSIFLGGNPGTFSEEHLVSWSKVPDNETSGYKRNDYTINEVTFEDEGRYICTVSSNGVIVKGEANFKVLSPPLLEDLTQIKFTNRVSLVVTCKLSRPDPSVTMSWQKKDSPIKMNHTAVNGDIHNNFTYQLIIFNPDKKDEGFYRCVASNKFGRETKTVKVSFISEPKIKAEQEEIFVKVSTSTKLKCILQDGIPPPRISWMKKGTEITDDLPNFIIAEEGSALIISRVREVDATLYSCLAINEAGNDLATINLQLATEPKIHSPASNSRVELEYGGTLEIPCKASGVPPPSITWSKVSNGAAALNEYNEDSLKLMDVTLDDGGEYVCGARNNFGKDDITINVAVTGLEKPSINGRDEVTTVKGLVGQRVELPCTLLSGNPIPNITWYKDGIRLTPSVYNNIVLSNGSFIIHVLTLRHIGNYECRVHNVVGQDRKEYILSTFDAPKMNLSLGSFILTKVGLNVTLPCHVRGDPQPIVTWYKEIDSPDRPNRGFRVNGSDNFYILNVVEEDSGRYICKGENIAGTARKSIILSVMSAPKILNFPQELSVISGDVVFLSCQTQGSPRPTVRWLKGGRPLLHVRGSIGSNYLRFFADTSETGEYTCIAENKAGEDRATTFLMILEPPKIDESSDNHIEGIFGQNVELPCKVTGTPRPFIIWQHKGQTIKKNIPSVELPTGLQIRNVTEEHKGTYVCIASNKAGSARKVIELSVLIPPSIEDWEGPIRVAPGDTVTISCRASGIPKPIIKWVKNGHTLPPEFISYDNILGFIVESSHSGNYTCIAMNKAGNDSKNVEISVYEAPMFVLEQSEDMEVLQGSDVQIRCSAIGDPKPVICWFYNGRIFESKHNVRFFQDKEGLLINKIDEEDEGIYECTATNKAGSNSRSIKINVLVPPKIIKWSDDLTVREGNEVILSCDVNGKPEPLVVWKKNGTPLPSDLSYRGNKIRFIATALDQGNYSCHASSKVGKDVKHTLLTVKVHPQILGEQELEIVALWGDGLELKCEARGVPHPLISWMLNSTVLNNLPNAAFKLKGTNLFIPKVEFHNEGLYICSANNSLGTVQKQIQVKVHVPPSITDDSHSEISLREGEDFSVSCSAYGIPIPDIFWINKDNIYKRGYHDDHYVVMNDHTLIISNAQLNMSGIYFCAATNVEGSAMKNYSIEVSVAPKDHIYEIGNLTLVEIEESDDGTLNCPLPSNSPIHWLKDDEGIDLSGNDRADDVHLQLLEGGHTLKLAEAYSSDTGVYTCYTDNGQTSQFFVQVLVKPHFLQEFLDMEFELKQGDQLSLDCAAEGNPPPKINWKYLEKNIPITRHTVPGVLVKGEEKDTLYFPAVKIHHAGRYMCIASNKVGREGRTFTVKVTEPPILIGEREQKITAVAGNNLDLDCTLDGSPKPRFSWIHISPKGEEISLRYYQKMLMINNLSPQDGGIYICNGTNKVGSTVKYFFVFILETPKIKNSKLEEIQLPEGKEMEVECEASGVPLPSLTWQLDSRPIDTTRAIITSTKPQTNGTLSSTLRIKAVDPSIAGIYTCFASNTVGTSQKHFSLSIIMPPVLLDNSFLVTNKSVDINEGQEIYLTCPVREDQHIDIVWFVTINGSRRSINKENNSKLLIPSAIPSDGGIYTCSASNPAGKIDASFIINISVPPVFDSTTYKKIITLNQDDELILNCSVQSSPLSQIVWLKDGTRIFGKKNNYINLINHNQTLIISDIKTGDSGKYICIASNPAGSAERSFQVIIHEAPKIDGIMSGQISMVTNKTETHYNRVTLRCPLTGSPQPTIEWYKDGLVLTANERLYITPQRGKVIIFYLTEEDAGHYSCKAQNQAGIHQLFFNVHLIVPLEWTQWTEWSNCSKNCDGGEQYRNRTCGQEPPLKYKQNSFIHYDNTACKGGDSEVRTCNTHPCKVDGEWGGWSEWSSCSASCGQGTRSRARRCDNPIPAFGGSRCKGPDSELSSCSRPPCPVNGKWSSWSEWSECTVSCGGGLKFRERRCNSPAPSDGGKPCPGSYREVLVCNQHNCPIDGRWSLWGKWSKCSTTCGTGIQARYRHCYRPMYGGRPCSGLNKETRKCENQPCDIEAYSEALRRSGRDMTEIETVVNDSTNHSSLEKEYIPMTTVNNSESGLLQPTIHQRNSGTMEYLTGRAQSFVERVNDSWSRTRMEGYHYSKNNSEHISPEISALHRQVQIKQNGGVQIFREINDAENLLGENSELSNYDSAALVNSDEVHAYFKSIKCPTGFRHDKTTHRCQDINECRHKKWNQCNKSRNICINTIGSYKCICASGYRLSDVGHKKKCIDVNECRENKSLCSHFCHNTRGSYKCSCPDGLTLLEDIHTCVKDSSSYNDYESDHRPLLDEYSEKESPPSLELTTNSELPILEAGYLMDSQSYAEKESHIICPKGFIVDGSSCKDINECSLGLDDCTLEQICINTLGYYKCYDGPCPYDYDLLPAIRLCQRNCSLNESKCVLGTKAETVTYETFDTQNKTISSLEDIVLLIPYDENSGMLNDTTYTVSDEAELPVDVRKENNLGMLYATDNIYVTDIKRIDIVGITRKEDTILYANHFIVFIYNSFALT